MTAVADLCSCVEPSSLWADQGSAQNPALESDMFLSVSVTNAAPTQPLFPSFVLFCELMFYSLNSFVIF